MSALAIAIIAIVVILLLRLSYVRGYNLGNSEGRASEAQYWHKLRLRPMAGQTMYVPAMGEVVILGRGGTDDNLTIDFILSKDLQGRSIPDLDTEELDRLTISEPLDVFVAQAELSLKY